MYDIPTTAAQLEFVQVGQGDQFENGWVHSKIAPFTIIALPRQGFYKIECCSQSLRVEPGEAFILGANHPVSFTHLAPADGSRETMSASWLHLHFTLYETIDFTSLLDMPLKLGGPPAAELHKLIDALRHPKPEPEPSLLQASRRMELAFFALRILCESSKMNPSATSLISGTQRLHAALLFIQNNLRKDLSVGQLAKTVHMSPSRFHAVFKQELGLSPMSHVRKARLHRAQQMLATSDDPISAVAEATGFKNQFHFSRAFKTAAGVTPSAFRHEHKTFPNG